MSADHKTEKGKQDYATPKALIRLVERRFNVRTVLDLAAHDSNHRCNQWINEEENSLTVDWKARIAEAAELERVRPEYAVGWINPPFDTPKIWLPKMAREADAGARFVSLTLADPTTEWYQLDVKPRAFTIRLIGRVKFEGMTQGYPKGLMLNLWGEGIMTGTMDWLWRKDPLYPMCLEEFPPIVNATEESEELEAAA